MPFLTFGLLATIVVAVGHPHRVEGKYIADRAFKGGGSAWRWVPATAWMESRSTSARTSTLPVAVGNPHRVDGKLDAVLGGQELWGGSR